jgi:hypothetical protein
MIRKFWLVAIFSFSILLAALAPSAPAQSAQDQLAPVYDASKETKIQGTIQQIETVKAGVAGTHLMISTPNGTVDAHLGAGPAADAKRLGLSLGQSVEVTGMSATMAGSNVFLARTLVVDSRTITLRNAHGIPVRAVMPQKTAAPKGGF